MPEAGRALVRDLLALGQVTLSAASVPTARWMSREEDANGSYDASYGIEGVDRDVVTLSKTRTNPEAKLREDALRPHADREDGSRGTYRIHRVAKRLESVTTSSKVELLVGKRSVGSSEGHLALTRVSATALPESAVAALAEAFTSATNGASSSDLGAHDVDERLEARIQRTELGDDTWLSLSARLRDESGDKTKAFLKLKALFLLQPERCADAGRSLVNLEDPSSRAFSLLSGALASAGTKQAQRALVEAAFAAEGRLEAQRTIVAVMGMVKSPSGETMDSLRRLAKETSNAETRGTVRLALGSLARSGVENEPARAGAIEASEAREFRAARTAEEKILALLALGNTGSPAAVGVVREALVDSDARVRAAAAAALRFVVLPEAATMLVDLLANDAAPSVRAESARSLSIRVLDAGAVDALARASERDSDEEVRMVGIQAIGAETMGDPAMLEVLERIASNDRAAGVRNAAKLALLRAQSRG